jgi:uncharacterized phage protein (TIGR02220 family)
MKELLLALNQRPISYYPIYAKILNSVHAGILLSQLMYWWSAVHGREFYKTDAEIADETSLSSAELRTAKKILKESGFVTIKAKGVPAKTHYIINHVFLQTSLAEFAKLDSLKQQICFSDFSETITENTTKTTQREEPVFDENASPSFFLEKPKRKKEDYLELIAQVVDYLNVATGRKFGYTTKTTEKSIIARAKEGYAFEDFAVVIDCKTAEWLHDSEFSKYLNPETLFGNKMEKYLVTARAENAARANTDTALKDTELDTATAEKYAAYINHAQEKYAQLWNSSVRVFSHSEFIDYLENRSLPAIQYGLTTQEKKRLLLDVHDRLNASADLRKKYSKTIDAFHAAARQVLRQETIKL